LSAVILVFSGQAVLYVVRERRRLWSSRPAPGFCCRQWQTWLIIATIATRGILMTALPLIWVGAPLGAAVVFAFALDLAKVAVFNRLRMA
jgi:H+-transporting ATPase